jgi:MYXO-CTERM domain-containing protein
MARALLVAVMIAAACSASYAVEEYSACVLGTMGGVPGVQCWNYTASNTSLASKYYIYQLLVSVDFDTYVTNVEGPTGWDPYFEDQQPDHFASWTCSDSDYYLMSGSQMSGFTVCFDRKPTSQIYSADFGSLLDEDERRNDTGNVSLWEPGSLSGAVVGLAMLGGALLRRRSS